MKYKYCISFVILCLVGVLLCEHSAKANDILLTEINSHNCGMPYRNELVLGANDVIDLSIKNMEICCWNNSIDVYWTPINDDRITGYIIVWSTDVNFKNASYKKISADNIEKKKYLKLGDRLECHNDEFPTVREVYSPTSALYYTISGLDYNQTYYLEIEAFLSIGEQDYFDFGCAEDNGSYISENELSDSIFSRAFYGDNSAEISTENNNKRIKKMNKYAPKHIKEIKKKANKYGFTYENVVRKEYHIDKKAIGWIDYNFSIWNENYIIDILVEEASWYGNKPKSFECTWSITTIDGRLYNGYSDFPKEFKDLIREMRELSVDSKIPRLDRKDIVIRKGESFKLNMLNCVSGGKWSPTLNGYSNQSPYIKLCEKTQSSVCIKGIKKGWTYVGYKENKGLKYYWHFCFVLVKGEKYRGNTSNSPGAILNIDNS